MSPTLDTQIRRYSRNTLLKQSLYYNRLVAQVLILFHTRTTQDRIVYLHNITQGTCTWNFAEISKKSCCHIYCTFQSSDLQDVSSYLFSSISFSYAVFFILFYSILVYFSNNLILQTSPSSPSLLFSIFPTFLPFLCSFMQIQ